MIVLDASAALAGLLNEGPAREALRHEQVHSPHLIDSEVANGLRRMVTTRHLTMQQGGLALRTWSDLGLTRYGTYGLLDRVWALRENVTAYDAGYVALAESLGCALVTADGRLSRAPDIRCPITVVPR